MISPFPRHQNLKKIRKDFSFLWKWHKNKIELCVHKVCPCFFYDMIINVLEHCIFHMKNISFHSDGWCICVYLFTLLLADVQWPPRERETGSRFTPALAVPAAFFKFFITSHDFGGFSPPFSRLDGDGNLYLFVKSKLVCGWHPPTRLRRWHSGENLCRQKKKLI
jgi:hypothetical protein